MADQNDLPLPDIDPVKEASEALLYGDPDMAAEKLRNAIHAESDRMANVKAASNRVQRELAASRKVAEDFATENPEWAKNPLIQGAVKSAMAVEQLNDLIAAGFNIGDFAEKMGRVPTHEEIFNMHLQARANGNPNTRSAKEWLDGAVAGKIEGEFGVRRRVKDVEHNRRRAIQDRIANDRKLRGLPPEDFGEEPPQRSQPREGDQPATPSSVQEWTAKQFGTGLEDDVPVRIEKRKSVIADMQRSRSAPNNMRFTRTADDYRYPDRRAAEAG
jgi:hypothetical protein